MDRILFRNNHRGAEAIEVALTVPMVMLVTLALLQFGIVVYAGQMAQEAARYGARIGSVAQSDAAGQAAGAAGSFAHSAFATGSPQVEILAPGGIVGSTLVVRVTYNVPNLMAGLGALIGLRGPIAVSAEAAARQEGW